MILEQLALLILVINRHHSRVALVCDVGRVIQDLIVGEGLVVTRRLEYQRVLVVAR